MDSNLLFWIVPAASLLALLFAWFFFGQMKRESEGTERMAYIAAAVRKGAMAYLKQQYKVVAVVFAVLAVILIYYILATLLPIDKIIGRFYPVFGVALLKWR